MLKKLFGPRTELLLIYPKELRQLDPRMLLSEKIPLFVSYTYNVLQVAQFYILTHPHHK